MFTGLVQNRGYVLKNEQISSGWRLILSLTSTAAALIEKGGQDSDYTDFQGLQAGESIAVNGVCLTLLAGSEPECMQFDVSDETLAKTNLGQLAVDQSVNLERAMRLSDRFGGHVVTGHVDRQVAIAAREFRGEYLWLQLGPFASNELPYLPAKGSVCVDGVSLTINAQEAEMIELLLIPHTLAVTQLGCYQVGDAVNIEFDYFSRLIVRQLQQSGILSKEVSL